MKNIEAIDMANKTELAKILARRKWCEGCALTSCGTKGCADYIKTWMDKECEAEENPPSDNEPQQEAPTKTMTNRDKFNKEIITKSNNELAHILSDSPCCYCYYNGDCAGVTCAIGVKMWLEAPCKDEENPPADNEPKGDIPPEVKVDLKKIVEGFDAVNKPAHYVKGGMECIDFIKVIVSDLTPYEAYCLGNVVKYLWRFKDKNGVVDLDKAVRYIEFLKEAQGNEGKDTVSV